MPEIAETLQRKVGPMPVWAWGVGAGGAFLAVKMLGGRSILGGQNSGQPAPTSPENDGDSTPTQTGPPGPAGPAGPAGPPGAGLNAPARPACPDKGWGWQYNPANNSWTKFYQVPFAPFKGDAGTWIPSWDTLTCAWKPILQPVTAPRPVPRMQSDAAAKGPMPLAGSLHGLPTISLGNVGGAYLAPPDPTPKKTSIRIVRNSIPGIPTLVGNPAADNSFRAPVGRPYHGS